MLHITLLSSRPSALTRKNSPGSARVQSTNGSRGQCAQAPVCGVVQSQSGLMQPLSGGSWAYTGGTPSVPLRSPRRQTPDKALHCASHTTTSLSPRSPRRFLCANDGVRLGRPNSPMVPLMCPSPVRSSSVPAAQVTPRAFSTARWSGHSSFATPQQVADVSQHYGNRFVAPEVGPMQLAHNEHFGPAPPTPRGGCWQLGAVPVLQTAPVPVGVGGAQLAALQTPVSPSIGGQLTTPSSLQRQSGRFLLVSQALRQSQAQPMGQQPAVANGSFCSSSTVIMPSQRTEGSAPACPCRVSSVQKHRPCYTPEKPTAQQLPSKCSIPEKLRHRQHSHTRHDAATDSQLSHARPPKSSASYTHRATPRSTRSAATSVNPKSADQTSRKANGSVGVPRSQCCVQPMSFMSR